MLLSPAFLLFWTVLVSSHVLGHQYNATVAQTRDTDVPAQPTDEFLSLTLCAEEEMDYEDDYDISVIIHVDKDGDGRMDDLADCKMFKENKMDINEIYKTLTLPEGVHKFLVKNVSCILYNSSLRCTWDTVGLPAGAQHSVTLIQDTKISPCDCFTNSDGNVARCHGKIEDEYITLQINVSFPNLLYIHSEKIDSSDIAKLNPPHNVTALVNPDRLVINWDRPSNLSHKCFLYQININGELTNVESHTTFILPNIALDKKYVIRVRVTKSNHCRSNNIWSDWSETVEVGDAQKPLELNILKIVAISLGIPMFLLAMLLLCRQPRIIAMLFPAIPSPSIRVKQLLETEVMQSKYTEEASELEDEHKTYF